MVFLVGGWWIETQIINNNSHQLLSLKGSKDDILSDSPLPQRIGFFSTCNRVDVKIHLQFLPFYKGAGKWRNYRRGTQQSFIRRGSAPRSNPSPFIYHFWQTRYPFDMSGLVFLQTEITDFPTLSYTSTSETGLLPYYHTACAWKRNPFSGGASPYWPL